MPQTLDGYRLLAASMESALSFPLILPSSRSDSARKVKVEGRIGALFLDHGQFLLEACRHAEGTHVVCIDSSTRVRWKGGRLPKGISAWEALALGDEIQVQGYQSGHGTIRADRIVRRNRPSPT